MTDPYQAAPPGEAAAGAAGAAERPARPAETTLWDLIDPELAGLAMASLYGTEAPCRMLQMAEACAEAGRVRDSAFWHAALKTSGHAAATGGARILPFSARTVPN